MSTEQEWIAHYRRTCIECGSYAKTDRWYELCPDHAPVVRCIAEPAYEAWVVRQKHSLYSQIERLVRTIDSAERIERGIRWIAEDTPARFAQGQKRIAGLKTQLDPQFKTWPLDVMKNRLTRWEEQLRHWQDRLELFHRERTYFAECLQAAQERRGAQSA